MQEYIFHKNGGSIPVCTERKATGEYVLACFMFATMVFRLIVDPPVRVFTGSDLITGSDRIGPEIGYLAHF